MNINQVYYVETTCNANPVAIKPEIKPSRIQWMDTSKGKVVPLGKINNIEALKKGAFDVIEVTSAEANIIHYVSLRYNSYNEKVKPRVMLPPSLESDEAVQKFYLEKDFEII